jgi:Ala-tRNA(Pro) deacylase
MDEEGTMLAQELTALLEENHVYYKRLAHPTAYTSQGVAASVHVPGREVAKTVVVRIDGKFMLAVLPAPCRVDLERLRQAAGGQNAALANEADLEALFPDCEVGAEPPFGEIYGLPVWVDVSLVEDEWIVFNGGTHTEAVEIAYADFARLARPKIAAFARR